MSGGLVAASVYSIVSSGGGGGGLNISPEYLGTSPPVRAAGSYLGAVGFN